MQIPFLAPATPVSRSDPAQSQTGADDKGTDFGSVWNAQAREEREDKRAGPGSLDARTGKGTREKSSEQPEANAAQGEEETGPVPKGPDTKTFSTVDPDHDANKIVTPKDPEAEARAPIKTDTRQIEKDTVSGVSVPSTEADLTQSAKAIASISETAQTLALNGHNGADAAKSRSPGSTGGAQAAAITAQSKPATAGIDGRAASVDPARVDGVTTAPLRSQILEPVQNQGGSGRAETAHPLRTSDDAGMPQTPLKTVANGSAQTVIDAPPQPHRPSAGKPDLDAAPRLEVGQAAGDGPQNRIAEGRAGQTTAQPTLPQTAQAAAANPLPPSVEYRQLARARASDPVAAGHREAAAGTQQGTSAAVFVSPTPSMNHAKPSFPAGDPRMAEERLARETRRETATEGLGLTAGHGAEPRAMTAGAAPMQAFGRADTQAIMRQIAEAAPRSGDGGFELRLNPEELGSVRLRMVPGEAGIMVYVQADRPETLDLLRRNIDQLAQELARSGTEAAGFSFGGESGGSKHSAPGGTLTAAGGSAELSITPDPDATIPITRDEPALSQGIDIRL